MKYSDIYRLYSTSQPKDAIHQALREVPVDDSDEQYEDRSPLHLACQYGDTEGVKILLERDAEPNTKDANGSTPIHILGRTSAGCADEDKLKEIAVMLIEQGGQEYDGPYRVHKEPSFQDGGSDHRFRSTRQLNRP